MLTQPIRLPETNGHLKQCPGPLVADPGGRLGGTLRQQAQPPRLRGQRSRSHHAPRNDPGTNRSRWCRGKTGPASCSGGAAGSYSQHASLARLGPGPGVWAVRWQGCSGGRQGDRPRLLLSSLSRHCHRRPGRVWQLPRPRQPASRPGPSASPSRLSLHVRRLLTAALDPTGCQGGPGAGRRAQCEPHSGASGCEGDAQRGALLRS